MGRSLSLFFKKYAINCFFLIHCWKCNPPVRLLVGLLVGGLLALVRRSVGHLFLKGIKLHFHDPFGETCSYSTDLFQNGKINGKV